MLSGFPERSRRSFNAIAFFIGMAGTEASTHPSQCEEFTQHTEHVNHMTMSLDELMAFAKCRLREIEIELDKLKQCAVALNQTTLPYDEFMRQIRTLVNKEHDLLIEVQSLKIALAPPDPENQPCNKDKS